MTVGLDFRGQEREGRDETSHPRMIIVITEGGECLQGFGLSSPSFRLFEISHHKNLQNQKMVAEVNVLI